MIHRAPLGTHERFVAFLIEHYGGAFPTWLAPVQVRVLTVSDRFDEYARNVVVRAAAPKACAPSWTPATTRSARRSATAAAEKVPNTLVIGEREVEEQTVTLRRLGHARAGDHAGGRVPRARARGDRHALAAALARSGRSARSVAIEDPL